MPTPFDLLSQQLDPEDPEDQLQMQLGQDQGANLAGGPEQTPDGQPNLGPGGQTPGGPAPPVQPSSPNVPGPLAALAAKPVKPKIKLLSPPKKKSKLKIKLKPQASAPPVQAPPTMRMVPRAKPHIKLKSGGGNGVRP
jgi:hypothetical protein